jgi:hypothetical protein
MRERAVMNKRNDTHREVLLDVCEEPLTSLDELMQRCHCALSAMREWNLRYSMASDLSLRLLARDE